MKIDAWATLPHFVAHISPIWRELDRRGLAGDFYTPRTELGGRQMNARDAAVRDRPLLVASYQDAVNWRSRPVIYVEHGAGQAYRTDRDSQGLSGFSGGDRMDHVSLFICPSQTVADRWKGRYPTCTTAVVGCAKLDRWHQQKPSARGLLTSEVTKPTITLAWHHDVGIIPETRWALPHYQPRFAELKAFCEAQGWRLIGHGHPRMERMFAEFYGRAGIQWVPDLATVFDTADLLVADNTSALPEFCSLGRPVVWLSAPWYRAGVEHGGRFWDWPRGQYQADDMDELLAVLPRALADPPEVRAARQTMVEGIYAYTDGRAAQRAVDAIEARF